MWLAHNLRASIAKIPDHCVAAMFVGMLRLHLCDVATASHRARSYLRGRTDTQIDISSTRWHLIQQQIACGKSILHANRALSLQRMAIWDGSSLSICFWHLGNVVLLWLSFVCGQHRVVSSTAFKEVCKFAQAHCNDHTSAGQRCCRGCFVSFNCNVMCFSNIIHAKS